MSDSAATRRRIMTKTHKRILGATGSIVVVVLVFAFFFLLSPTTGRSWTWVHGLDSAGLGLSSPGRSFSNSASLSTAVDGGCAPGLGYRDAMALTQASTAALDWIAGGRGRRRRRLVLDAAVVEVRGERSHAGGRDRGGSGTSSRISPSPAAPLLLTLAADEDHPALDHGRVGQASWSWRSRSPTARLCCRVRNRPYASGTSLRGSRIARSVLCPAEDRSAGPATRSRASRTQALGLLRRRWRPHQRLATLAGHLTVFVLLLVCLRVTAGLELGGHDDRGRLAACGTSSGCLGVLPLTPAGVRIVEVGLTGALVAFGAPNAEAVGA